MSVEFHKEKSPFGFPYAERGMNDFKETPKVNGNGGLGPGL